MPHSLQTGNTILKLSPNFKISTPAISNPPQDLVDAINRTMSYLKGDQLGRLVVGRGANDSVAQAPSLIALNLMLGSTSLPIKSITEEATKDIALRLESYSLSVPSTDQGTANITASSSLGLLRGLTTFTQLWYQTSETIYTYQAPVNINDTAAYVKFSLCCTYDYLFTHSFLAVSRALVGYCEELVSSSCILTGFCFP